MPFSPHPPPAIQEARRRFALSLVGRWSTISGITLMWDQLWEIRSDGTGKFTNTGPLYYPVCETHFEWRQSTDFTFELRLTHRVFVHPEDEHELPDEELEWQSIRYDFVEAASELLMEVGMIDRAQAGAKFEGFHQSLAPLGYRGPIS